MNLLRRILYTLREACRPRDFYDDAIDFFSRNPDEISASWRNPRQHEFGALFGPTSSEGREDGYILPCVTMIKKSHCGPGPGPGPGPWSWSWTGDVNRLIIPDRPDITQAIVNDPRVPLMVDEKTTREELEVIAEWRRELDKELNLRPPTGSIRR